MVWECWGGERVGNLVEVKRIMKKEQYGYDTKQSDEEAPVVMALLGMQITPSLPLLPGPLSPGVVAPERILSMGQMEWFEI